MEMRYIYRNKAAKKAKAEIAAKELEADNLPAAFLWPEPPVEEAPPPLEVGVLPSVPGLD